MTGAKPFRNCFALQSSETQAKQLNTTTTDVVTLLRINRGIPEQEKRKTSYQPLNLQAIL